MRTLLGPKKSVLSGEVFWFQGWSNAYFYCETKCPDWTNFRVSTFRVCVSTDSITDNVFFNISTLYQIICVHDRAAKWARCGLQRQISPFQHVLARRVPSGKLHSRNHRHHGYPNQSKWHLYLSQSSPLECRLQSDSRPVRAVSGVNISHQWGRGEFFNSFLHHRQRWSSNQTIPDNVPWLMFWLCS